MGNHMPFLLPLLLVVLCWSFRMKCLTLEKHFPFFLQIPLRVIQNVILQHTILWYYRKWEKWKGLLQKHTWYICNLRLKHPVEHTYVLRVMSIYNWISWSSNFVGKLWSALLRFLKNDMAIDWYPRKYILHLEVLSINLYYHTL